MEPGGPAPQILPLRYQQILVTRNCRDSLAFRLGDADNPGVENAEGGWRGARRKFQTNFSHGSIL